MSPRKEPASILAEAWRWPVDVTRYDRSPELSPTERETMTRLAKSYAAAGYFARNLRAIEVLIDQEVVRSGRAAVEPWKHYDLGHGYCTYDFFDQCPHRMACARCDFYLPKDSAEAQILEGKDNLLRLRQQIPLNESELAAVEEGVAAYERLIDKLRDVPTPAGTTPRQLNSTDEDRSTTSPSI